MAKNSAENNKKNTETAQNTASAAPGVAAEKKAKAKELADNLEEAKKKSKDIEAIYGKHPSQEEIVAKFQESNTEAFQGKSYQEIMDILKNGTKDKDGKIDETLQSKDLHERLQKNTKKQSNTPKQETANKTEKSQETTTANKPEQEQEAPKGNKPEQAQEKKETPKPQTEKKEIEKPKIKETERWKEEDENSRPGSRHNTEQDKAKTEKEEKAPKEGKSGKRIGGFFKAIGKTVARPFKNAGKLGRTVGRTLRTPVGLTSYLLSDIGEKKASGWKDRRAGYGKIWKGK